MSNQFNRNLLQLNQPAGHALGLAPMGIRHDGTGAKGKGFFGPMPSFGGTSTELSAGMNVGGNDMEVPLMVPSLSPQELSSLMQGQKPTEEIYRKAMASALRRGQGGESPFAGSQELYMTPGMLGEMSR